MADLEANGLCVLYHCCRRWRASRADAHLSWERPSHALGGVGQHVKHDGRATEVGDPMARDGGVHGGSVDAAEVDVCGACGGINPYTLTAKLGLARIDGFGPPKDNVRPG